MVVLVLVSCNIEDMKTETSSIVGGDSGTPYATESELQQIVNNPAHLHYKLARALALEELIGLQLSEGYQVSEKPVIIYQVNGTPVYYEYRVVKDGIAYQSFAIPVNISQGIGISISLDQANDYSSPHKSPRVIEVMYPTRYGVTSVAATRSRSLSTMSLYISEEVGTIVPADFYENTEFAELFNPKSRNAIDPNYFLSLDMDDDAYWNIVARLGSIQDRSGNSIVTEAKQNYEDLKAENIALYGSIERNVDIIMGMTDKEIEEYIIENQENEQNSRWSGWQGNHKASKIYTNQMASDGTWKKFMFSYNNWNFDGSYWNKRWCGPFALAMIISGRNHKDEFSSIQNNFRSYFDRFNNANKSDGAVSMHFLEFRKALRDNGWGDIEWGYGAVWRDSAAEDMYDHIKGGDPLLVHVWGHWIFAFETEYRTKKTCFWTRTQRDFKMTDNGSWGRSRGGTWWMNEDNWRIIWVHPLNID